MFFAIPTGVLRLFLAACSALPIWILPGRHMDCLDSTLLPGHAGKRAYRCCLIARLRRMKTYGFACAAHLQHQACNRQRLSSYACYVNCLCMSSMHNAVSLVTILAVPSALATLLLNDLLVRVLISLLALYTICHTPVAARLDHKWLPSEPCCLSGDHIVRLEHPRCSSCAHHRPAHWRHSCFPSYR
jgi:hypothetical protein